jgi:integrase
MRVENEYLAMFYLGLLVSGCRVRELLNVSWTDVSVFGQLYISGSKGSGSRSITIPGYEAIMLDFKRREINPFYCLSYSYIYRSFIRFGLTIESTTGERRKVAHSLRYQAISGMYDQTRKVKKVADIIGHRTEKTTDYYLRKGRSQIKVKKSK